MFMNSQVRVHDFEERELASIALAKEIAEQLNSSIIQKGIATIALSGGSTPMLMLQALAKENIDWDKVVVTLVDDRWVPESNARSNARFLSDHLFAQLNSPPTFIPLVPTPIADAPSQTQIDVIVQNYQSATGISPEQIGFDVVVLGMGGDGHTASFFPDADNISDLIDPQSTSPLLTCHSTSSVEPRITWSLPVLLRSTFLSLLMFGEDKKTVFNDAILLKDCEKLPIASVIHQDQTDLNLFYAK